MEVQNKRIIRLFFIIFIRLFFMIFIRKALREQYHNATECLYQKFAKNDCVRFTYVLLEKQSKEKGIYEISLKYLV